MTIRLVSSLLYGCATSVLVALVAGFARGALDRVGAIVALVCGACLTIVCCRGSHRRRREPPPKGWEWFAVLLYLVFTLRAFLWLIFRDADQLLVLSPNNLGDMSLHLTFINYLANGATFWPDSPIFAQGKLAYSVGIDLFNSLLVLVGVDLVRGLIWVGLIGALCAGVALWNWGRAFALLGFLCSGSLVSLAAFGTGGSEPFFQDYPGLLKFDWEWKNLPLALLVTQRGFLFALPAGLLVIASWKRRYIDEHRHAVLPVAGELLLYAAMPVFHIHTFLVLSFVLACLFLARTAHRFALLRFVGLAFLPATALVYLTTGTFRANAEPASVSMEDVEAPIARPSTSVLGWQPGWQVNAPLERLDPWALLTGGNPAWQALESHGRFLIFWLGNFGLFLVLGLILAWMSLRSVTKRRLPWWGALTFATLACVVTPLLGQWTNYQHQSLREWLLGSTRSISLHILFAAIIIFTAAGALWLRRTRRSSLLEWFLLTIAAILTLDGVMEVMHRYAPAVPLLRANALPLLFATAGLLAVLVRLTKKGPEEALPASIVLPAIYLFFVCCNVKFAPSAWDNTKIMLWAYVLILPFLWSELVRRLHVPARAVALVVLFFPGFVTLIGGLNSQYNGYAIADLSELDEVREATRAIPISESFAAEPTYNHPLLLNGRKLVLGYPAHVWSHGIDFSRQERLLDELMVGSNRWRMSGARLEARYLYFGPREAERWPRSQREWQTGAATLYKGSMGLIIDLETPPLPLAEGLLQEPALSEPPFDTRKEQ